MRKPARGTAVAPPPLRVAVVGAGVSGLATAKVLAAGGLDVTVFEREQDIGGVWSAAHAYPGISTQDDRRSYSFSDFPMPGRHSERVPGPEVRAYLERYAQRHAIDGRIRLATRVVRAHLLDDEHWEIESEGPSGRLVEHFDWLVMANGTFSTPHVPSWPGRDLFERAGGAVLIPRELGDGRRLDERRIVVVGWGKTACDVAAVAAARGARVDVVARTLTWKYPPRLDLLGLTDRHLTLTRAGERILGGSYRSPSGRLLLRRFPERIPRMFIGRMLANATDRRLGLTRLGLRPTRDFRASTSLVTEGFFEAVADGRIVVHRDANIERLGAGAAGPVLQLTTGEHLDVGVVVAATGYDRTMDFLDPAVVARLLGTDGAFLLHRRILAIDVPRLAFIGWTHHYRTPLSVEIAASWLAGVLAGRVALPAPSEQRALATHVPLARDSIRAGLSNTVVGLQMRDLDQLLRDVGRSLPRRLRLRQIWDPIDPADYATALRGLAEGVHPGGGAVEEG